MRLLYLLFSAVTFLVSLLTAHPTAVVGRNDSGIITQHGQTQLKDVPKQKVFRNEEKTRNKVLVVKNFMLQEQIPLVTSSAMVPIYKRTEFMVLSAGVVLYWIVMVFIGTILIMCCICTRSQAKRDEEEEVRKIKKDDRTEDV